MRQLISIILGMALVFSSVSTSFAKPEKREFEGCVYDGNIAKSQIILDAVERGGENPIPTDKTPVGVIVECEDDTKYSLTNVIVYSTLGVVAGAAIGVSIAFFSLSSRGGGGFGLTEYLQSRGQNTFELNPTFDFEQQSAGLKFSIRY